MADFTEIRTLGASSKEIFFIVGIVTGAGAGIVVGAGAGIVTDGLGAGEQATKATKVMITAVRSSVLNTTPPWPAKLSFKRLDYQSAICRWSMPDSTYLKWPDLKCPSLAGFGCPLTHLVN